MLRTYGSFDFVPLSIGEQTMSNLCRRILYYTYVLLTASITGLNGQIDLDVMFRTVNDEYITFEGEDVGVQCSHLANQRSSVTSIYYGSGEEIIVSSTIQNETHIILFATLRNVANNPTVFCNVNGLQQETAELTIKTLPRDASPYCKSNYTGIIMLNTVIELSCYVDILVPVNEHWRTSGGASLNSVQRVKIFPSTRRTVSTVVPADNDTRYICANILQGSIVSSCQVGPIYVYENIVTEVSLSTNVQSHMTPFSEQVHKELSATTSSTSFSPKNIIPLGDNLSLYLMLAAVVITLVIFGVLLSSIFCRLKRSKRDRKTEQSVESSKDRGGYSSSLYSQRNRSGEKVGDREVEYGNVGSSIGWSNRDSSEIRSNDIYHQGETSFHMDISDLCGDFNEKEMERCVNNPSGNKTHQDHIYDNPASSLHNVVYRNVISK